MYKYLNQVKENGGNILYMDTGLVLYKIKYYKSILDSIIFKYKTDLRWEGEKFLGLLPIQSGKFLGNMMDEYPNHRILEFVGG